MENSNSNNYITDNFEDVMDTSEWATAASPYGYPQQQQQPQLTQEAYPRFDHNQSSYGQFGMQQQHQPSYSQLPFQNSPYSSVYQQDVSSPSYGEPNYHDINSSLPNSLAYQNSNNNFAYGSHEAATIAPQSLQYSLPPSRNITNGAYHQTNHPAVNASAESHALYNHPPQTLPGPPAANPTQYRTPSNQGTEYPSKIPAQTFTANVSPAVPARVHTPQAKTETLDGDPLRITHRELFDAPLTSSRMSISTAPYMLWNNEAPILIPPGLKNNIPKYHPRKSKSGKDPTPNVDLLTTTKTYRTSKKNRVPKDPKVTASKYTGTIQPSKKLPLGRPDTPHEDSAATPSDSSSLEESSSEDESEYEDEPTPAPKDISSVRSLSRPLNEIEAAGWDAIGIVWKDPSAINPDVVKSAIEEFGNFVSAIRVKLKALATKIEQSASSPAAELNSIKRERVTQLEVLYQAINSANELGYPTIVENLGNHHKLVNGLTTTLIECSKINDYSGKLPKAIFKMLSKFQTLSDDLLDKVKFPAIKNRWTKKNDDKDIKRDIAAILSNTTDAKAKASSQPKKDNLQTGEEKGKEKGDQAKPRAAPLKSLPAVSAKRPHEADANSAKPNKKFASDTDGSSSKPAFIKRPTLSNNNLGITTKPVVKPAPKKREVSPPQVSKLGALLASIAKDPEPVKAVVVPARAPETPEEKKRRERKESRRHLRVTFKEGPALEEVRLFKHVEEEDEGRQDNMLKDAHDDRSEGMMHKKRVSEHLDGATETEDDDLISDNLSGRSYPKKLLKVDLLNVPKTTMFGSTYTTRGGDKAFTTPEQKTQAQREALELMVVYTDPSDIPPTPKEPPQGDTIQLDQEHQLRAATEPWLVQRLHEIQQFGPEYATQMMLSRRADNASKVNRSSNSQTVNGGLPSLAVSTQAAANSSPVLALDMATLESLISVVQSLRGKPYPANEPPDWMTESRKAEWWVGYNRDMALNKSKAFATQEPPAPTTSVQSQPLYPAPSVQQIPQPQIQSYIQPSVGAFPGAGQQSPEDVTQQVQAYLAGIYNGQPITSIQNAVPAPHQQHDWVSGNNGKQQFGFDGQYDNDTSRSWSNHTQEKDKPHKKHKFTTWTDGPLDANGEYKGKKKPCKFFQQGKCAKGEKCTFLHDE